MRKFNLCALCAISSISLVAIASCSSEASKFNFSITVDGNGKVTGVENGKYDAGFEISLTATPNDGYAFDGYYKNNSLVSKDLVYTFKLESDTALTAKFVEKSYVTKKYSHNFVKEDFKYDFANHVYDAGKTDSINGLTWEYTTATYAGFGASGSITEGAQIGSSKKPQSPEWSMVANFPAEAILKSYSIELGNGSKGSGTYTVSYGDVNDREAFSSPQAYTVFSKENINKKTNSFKLSLEADAKAIYIHNVSFTLDIPSNAQFDIGEDGGSVTPNLEPNPDPTPNPDPNPGEGGGTVTPDTGNFPKPSFTVPKEEYYKNLDLNSSTIQDDLFTLIHPTNQTSYGDARYMLGYTDQKINDQTKLNGMFDGTPLNTTWDQGATWNREHVWPKSLLGVSKVSNSSISIATDLHNLRACKTSTNGAHGDKMYGDGSNGTFFPNQTSSTSRDLDYRGDTARIIFYMFVAYNETSIGDSLSGSGNYMGNANLLKEWAKADPVDEFEIQRNNRIYGYQGNRNPFIDFPELIDKITY